MNEKKLSSGTIFGYGIAGVGNAIGGGLFYSWFLFFLTAIAGLNPAIAGTVSMVAVLWDAINDPLIGHWCDNNRHKGGRRRFFQITGVIPTAIVLVLMFTNIDAVGNTKVLYYMAMNILFWFAFTWTDVPTLALVDNLDCSYNEKTKAKTAWTVIMMFGNILSVSLPPVIVEVFENMGYSTDVAWRNMGLLMGIILFLAYFVSWLATSGREVMPHNLEKTSFNFIKMYKGAFKNKAMRNSMIGVALLYLGFNGAALPTMAYILTYNLGLSASSVTMYMMVYTISSIIGSYVLGTISSRGGVKLGGKARQLAIPSIIYGIVSVLGIILGNNAVVVVIVFFTLGFCTSAFFLHGWNLGLDAAKVDEYQTGIDKGCEYVAFIGFLFKIGGAIGMWLIGFTLDVFGFNSEAAVQSDSALLGIQLCFYVLSGVFMILGALVLFKNPLTRAKLDLVIEGIAKKRNGEPVDESGFADLL